MDCIFCKIVAGEIPSTVLYRDEKMVVIQDIEPKAERHYLAIPVRHYALIEEMTDSDRETLGYMAAKIASLKGDLGLSGGYRLVINQGDDAGQTVRHLHIHIMGGQELPFPDMRK